VRVILTKSCEPEELVHGFRAAIAGESYLAAEARAKIVVLSGPEESPQSLLAFVQAGVHGVLPRHQEALARELAIGRILRGERYFAADRLTTGAGP
jgi:DNA-binding NarL/FixJ family response regulator